MKRSDASVPAHKGDRGFALVITLIMVVLAAIIAVGLLVSASLDRLTANAFSKRLRAELAAQSGLAAALNALSGTKGPASFQYITGVGDDGKPVLVPLQYAPATGTATLDLANKRDLYSSVGASTDIATLILSPTATPRPTRAVPFVPITTVVNGVAQEVERYAFYVDEGGGRQNLAVQGGANRNYSRDPSELPFVSAKAAPAPFSATQINAITTGRQLIFTPMTTNPLLSAASAPMTPPVDDYSFATASAIANLNPEGKPRVDLKKLQAYVDGLSTDQTKSNPRAALVNQLLDPNETGTNWGGGNLSIITKLTRYSGNQPKQIVANLLDYLDDDLIPTTDDVDNPTYFGVEGKTDTSGKVVGHPYINFVGTGLVFNRSAASGATGGLNSTRVLVVLGLVNPWSTETKDWTTFYIKPEIEITITGTATGGLLGPNASSYFHGVFNTTDTGNQMTSYPPQLQNGKIPPNQGFVFPTLASSGTNYATFFDILGTSGRQPPGMVFDGLGFTITKLRLKYTSTDGKNGYVQLLDNLKNTPQPANPSTVPMGNAGGSLVYKFASGAPDKADFHLNADPRLDFLPGKWLLSKSTDNGANPPTPQTIVDIFSGKDPSNWDFTAQTPSVTNQLWYTKTDITRHFYVKSPPSDGSEPKFQCTGELGYLHTGLPWETLRLYVTDAEAATPTLKSRDRELLAYVHSGTFASTDYRSATTHVGQAAPATPIPLLSGPLNINTNKRPTLTSLFLGASALLDSDAASRAQSGSDPDMVGSGKFIEAYGASVGSPQFFALPGDFLSSKPARDITNAQTFDYDREALARRSSNLISTQSTRFTVYSLGEARDKVGANVVTTSSVNLRAEVELQTDSSGKPTPKVLSSTFYLTN